MRVLIAGLAVLTLLAPRSAEAQASPGPGRVLVMPFSVTAEPGAPGGAAATRWLGEAAASQLTEELAAAGVAALPREDRVEVFDRLQVPMTSQLTRATMIRIGELIGASEIVFGDVRAGATLTVRVRTMRLSTGRHLPDVVGTGPFAEMFPLFGRLSADLLRHIGRGAAPAARPAAMPLPAFENYIKGLIAATPAAQQRFLESAMSQAPRDGRVLTALWSLYTDQDLHDKALAVASAVPADSPHARRARFNVALSLIELKRFDGAFKELTALHERRRSAAISNAIGIVQLRRGAAISGPGSATFYFERAANEAPEQSDYLFNLGYARGLAGDSAGALLWLRETVRHHAADGDAHLVMAALLAATGRNAESHRELELARLLGTSLDNVPATIIRVPPRLERIRLGLDDTATTLATLRAPAQRDQGETARFHLERARQLLTAGNDREAQTELRRSIYLAPYEDEPHLLLGRLLQRAGRLPEAIDEFKVALWCRETAAAHIGLGSALFESGERDDARQAFERALALSPNSAEARDWLKRIGGERRETGVLPSSRP
jgi:tetratricopeptide (TPR) repeat protein